MRKLCVQKFLVSLDDYLDKKNKKIFGDENEEINSILKKFYLKHTSIYLANKLGLVIEKDDIQERLEKIFDLWNQVKSKDHLYRIKKDFEVHNIQTLKELK